MGWTILGQCANCKHLGTDEIEIKEDDMEAIYLPTCAAFLRGIPREIRTNEVDHTKPFPGDHGIQFEAI